MSAGARLDFFLRDTPIHMGYSGVVGIVIELDHSLPELLGLLAEVVLENNVVRPS